MTSGRICIDGQRRAHRSRRQSLRRCRRRACSRMCSCLPTPSANNIRYGRPDATTEEIRAGGARSAEIDMTISCAMPDGFDTYVGERGAHPVRRAEAARCPSRACFLKNPPILILDEATSALDSVTEAKIQRALDHLAEGRTTLIIAHRLSTIRSAVAHSCRGGRRASASRARTRSLCASAACMRPCAARRTSAARNDPCESPKFAR